jgi:hypothetical protein
MKLIQIRELIEKGNNLIFYDKDVNPCYDVLKDEYLCVYFDEPTPARIHLIEIVNKIRKGKKFKKSSSIPEIKKFILKELGKDRLIIIFNHFERLNYQSVRQYQDLNENKNIQFICNFTQHFKEQILPFYQTFVLINKSKYKDTKIDEINVTYPVYILISLFCFLLYMKISSTSYDTFTLMGGVWFALIIFRTLMYAGGRI